MSIKNLYQPPEPRTAPDTLGGWLKQSSGYLVRLNRRVRMTMPAAVRERLNLTPATNAAGIAYRDDSAMRLVPSD